MEPDKKQLKKREQRVFEDRDPLEREERAIVTMGDEFQEEKMEEEEISMGEDRDVVQEVASEKIISNPDGVPAGLEEAEDENEERGD